MSAADVDRLLDEAADDSEFVPAVKAEKLAAQLRETAPSALDDWLHENAVAFLTDALSRRISTTRARTLRRAKARAFGRATVDAEEGDDEGLRHFVVLYVVDEGSTRRRVADMTGDDHKFVAANYGASGRCDLMLEAFHLAVAKKVGRRRTADVMSEEQYDAILQSIVKRAA